VRSDKRYKSRILFQVTIQAASPEAADRRWARVLTALDTSRYPGMKIEQQIEPYWSEIIEEETNDNDS
jgi:hypothetical protein